MPVISRGFVLATLVLLGIILSVLILWTGILSLPREQLASILLFSVPMVVVLLVFLLEGKTRRFKRASKTKQKYPKLSIIGIMRERRVNQTQEALIALLLALIVYILLPKLINYTLNNFVLSVLALLIILLAVGKGIFDYRVQHGFYGNNEREAREVIQFIIQESENIDFTDNGKLKSIISEKDLKEIEDVIREAIPAVGAN